MPGRADSPMDVVASVPSFSLTYDNKNPRDSAEQLAQACDSTFTKSPGSIKLSQFTDGITNTIIKVSTQDASEAQSVNDHHAVVLRIYGRVTDALIDRAQEIKTHALLASKGLAPSLLARFSNGIIYRFCPGDVCTAEDLRRPDVYREVAKTMGEWHGSLPVSAFDAIHSNEVSQSGSCPNIWTVLKRWIDKLPSEGIEQVQRRQELQQELNWIISTFAKIHTLSCPEFVFAHTDLLSGNIILEEKTSGTGTDNSSARRAIFIDYEYATPAPAAFDVANHFSEWAGLECNYNNCPSKGQREDFLRSYISSYNAHLASRDGDQKAGEPDLESMHRRMFEQVDLFRGIPGLFWGVWSLHQKAISSHDFDYESYSKVRLDEYWSWKAEFDGSREREGKAKGAREARWAQE